MMRLTAWSLGALVISVVAACGTSNNTSKETNGALVDGGSPPTKCKKNTDCTSKICGPNGICTTPTCSDGAQNGDETDIDCGGSCAPCDLSKTCNIGADCATDSCRDVGQGMQCQAPACDDGVKNGDETDVDCGGPTCEKCDAGSACTQKSDCTTDVCTDGECVEPTCNDGQIDGTKTDVDCGGPDCPRCAAGESCKTADDCTSSVCKDMGQGLKCQPPSCTDGVLNGDETAVDCGGSCPKCATGQTCKVHADCVSDGCDYSGKCALRRSCTAHYGGDTCGGGGEGGQGAATWESCCTTAPAGAGGVQMDKYKITAGRIRAFMERTKGDVRAAVRELRAAGKIGKVPNTNNSLMDPGWDLYLPTAMDGCDQNGTCGQHPDGAGGTDSELSDHFYGDTTKDDFEGIYSSAYRHVGGSIWSAQDQVEQGCSVGSPGTHSYWMDAATQLQYFGDIPAEQPQTIYDTKPINCTTYLIMQAFCLWDGGRLETLAEWVAAIGPAYFPWGASPSAYASSVGYVATSFPDATDVTLELPASISIEYANFNYSYQYPTLADDQYDYIVFLSAPGRLPKGNGPWGHADLAYSMFETTSDITTWSTSPKSARMNWANNGSWEGHGYGSKTAWGSNYLLDKYGKTSGRCVYP